MRPLFVVAAKEIVDNARDRRTLFSTLLFGPLFGPLMFAVLVNVMVTRNVASVSEPIDVPIIGAERAPNLVEFLHARGIHAADLHGLDDFDAGAAAVRAGRQDLVIVIDPRFAEQFGTAEVARVGLIYDQSNTRANSRVSRARAALAAYRNQIANLRLLARGIRPDIMLPLTIDEYDVSTPAGRSALLLGMLTYFLLFATLMGGLYLAIDTTAGERERKSLEPLLATPVSRASLLLGKMAATVCYMLLALVLTLIGFTIALRFLPLEQLGMSSGFDLATAAAAFAVLAPFTPLGAALMTVIASFTRSYKEAQTWLGVVVLVPTLPVILASLMNVKPTVALMWIPSLSQHLLVTSLIRQEPIEPAMAVISTISTLSFSVLIAWVAIRLYKREALLG